MSPDEFDSLLTRLLEVVSQARKSTTDIEENVTLVATLDYKIAQLSKLSDPSSLQHIAEGYQLKETATDHLKSFLQARKTQLDYLETATKLVASDLKLEWTEHRFAEATLVRTQLEQVLQAR
ncbi:hypothetical protein CC1G_12673 [Coprinopsis cinerea okayama7|uniref:Uncharacterized protein n=1 Tax=Coprinopsis cinerea (strain Okayama-7 / 130 / ATCC MYA-4618 / FGSC 9003) TaxID=240176 RepID=A8PHL9_COPC7|nr:hypothetical protein CC1G_12673 [Coprinopsis cinerea okayama7\|eukprot:XP_001841433.1 hypothetical protein CC1G_12673 [Coprinopsis cinerea okayama7\